METSKPSLCKVPMDAIFILEENLLLFFTGFSRTPSSILSDQYHLYACG